MLPAERRINSKTFLKYVYNEQVIASETKQSPKAGKPNDIASSLAFLAMTGQWNAFCECTDSDKFQK